MNLQCVIHYPHLKIRSKIFPLNQQKFQILDQNKEARRKLGEENPHEQQSKSYLDSSKHGAHNEYYKKFTIGSNIAKRMSEGEGTSASSNIKIERGPGKVQNNYFQNSA